MVRTKGEIHPHSCLPSSFLPLPLFIQVIGKIPRRRHQLQMYFVSIQWPIIILVFKPFPGKNNKKTQDPPRSIQAQSSQKPGVENVPKLINSRPFIFGTETLCDLPKDKRLLERHNDPDHKIQSSSTFRPLKFHTFSMINSPSHIQFGFPTSANMPLRALLWRRCLNSSQFHLACLCDF